MQKYGIGDPAASRPPWPTPRPRAEVRVAALSSLAASKDAQLAEAVKAAMADKSEDLRSEAIRSSARCPAA